MDEKNAAISWTQGCCQISPLYYATQARETFDSLYRDRTTLSEAKTYSSL